MARTLTQQDCYALMNQLVAEATGQADITVADLSSFVSAGEKVLSTGTENTLNALSLVLGRTIVAVRPYKAKLMSVQAIDTGEYSHRIRKISYFSRNALPAGNWNTQLYPENLFQGKTNAQDTTTDHESTKSMWMQNQPQALEMNFGGSSVWDYTTTVYERQLKPAFRDPAVFAEFVAGIMTEVGNDIESEKEAFNRVAILNKIGDIYLNGSDAQKVNLTAAYNAKFGTNYTSAQLRSTYLESFLKFFVSTFKIASDRLTERSVAFHMDVTKSVPNAETGVSETLHILRHTPKDAQKALLYNPLFVESQAWVMPSIFNPEYLRVENYEGVDFWQSNYDEDARPAVNVYPAVYDALTGQQKKGDQANIPYVVGLLFDRDAVLTDFQFDWSASTPLEARKGYRNMIWHFSKNAINDPTENAILFYMDDESEGAAVVGTAIVGTDVAG